MTVAPRNLLTSQRPRGMLDNADFSKLIVKMGDLGGGPINLWRYDDTVY